VTDGSAVLFLGGIAIATIVMALIQVGAIIVGVRLARRVSHLVTRVEQELSPTVRRLADMSGEASRAAAVAVQQVEKIDRLVTDASQRLDRALASVQGAIDVPAREGAAIAEGVRTSVRTWRELRRQQRAARFRPDDDDPLFIG
jgi:hypothetical protein